jgi:hypothetical protein
LFNRSLSYEINISYFPGQSSRLRSLNVAVRVLIGKGAPQSSASDECSSSSVVASSSLSD